MHKKQQIRKRDKTGKRSFSCKRPLRQPLVPDGQRAILPVKTFEHIVTTVDKDKGMTVEKIHTVAARFDKPKKTVEIFAEVDRFGVDEKTAVGKIGDHRLFLFPG